MKIIILSAIAILVSTTQVYAGFSCLNEEFQSSVSLDLESASAHVKTNLGTATVMGPVKVSDIQYHGKHDFTVEGELQWIGEVRFRSNPSSYSFDILKRYLQVDMSIDGLLIPLWCEARH